MRKILDTTVTSVGETVIDETTKKRIYATPTEPFYEFGRVSVIIWHEIDLLNFRSLTGKIDDYYGDCAEIQVNAINTFKMIKAHLQMFGFNTSSLDGIQITQKEIK